MLSRIWTNRRAALPINVRYILVGMVGGLISGVLRLHLSLDEASTAGFVSFVSLTIGVWLGIHMSIWMLSLTGACLDVLMRRADILMERLGFEDETVSDRSSNSLAQLVVKGAIYITPALVPAWVYCLLYVIVGSQTPVVSTTLTAWLAYILFVLIVVGLGVQWGKIWSLWRILTFVERKLNERDLVQLDVGLHDKDYDRMRGFVEWVAGRKVLAH